MTDKQFEQIINKLEQILKILSFQILSDSSITERVRILKSIGLTNIQISEVLNIPVTSVRTLSSRINKIK